MKLTRRDTIALIAALALGAGVLFAFQAVAENGRQEEIADRGSIVMPFDLDRTTHIFEPRAFGGIQTVVADDPTERRQIRLIRQHLRAEATSFARGDFGDPAEIHDDDMPGLQELETNYEQVTVTFGVTSDGARITYRSNDPTAVTALHDWFEAQANDHGGHAEHR